MSVERSYDPDSDRLFLVYYSLPPGLNANKWGVSHSSLPVNIKTAINKPVIIYPKQPTNLFHSKQAGNYVHPTPEEAAAETGYPLAETDYYKWQEKFAVGRIKDVELRGAKGYAWTLEITDPVAKSILKSDDYKDGIPGWTSPQILTYPHVFPNEERTGVHDHWVVSHVILTDRPAYGFEKSSLRGKCLGTEKECTIKTKNASTQENLGFCVKQATIDLIDSRSSHNEQNSTLLHNTMSQTETSPTSETAVVTTKTLSEQNQKQEGEQQAPPAGSGIGVEGDANERERPQSEAESSQPEESQEATLPKTIEEAHRIIAQQSELVKTMQKEMKGFKKELDQIKTERKLFQLQTIIPRNLFKSDESYLKEIQKTMQENVSESYLKDYWNTKRELAALKTEVPPIPFAKAKSASLDTISQYQPQDGDTQQRNNLSSTIERELNLPRKMFEGGGTR